MPKKSDDYGVGHTKQPGLLGRQGIMVGITELHRKELRDMRAA